MKYPHKRRFIQFLMKLGLKIERLPIDKDYMEYVLRKTMIRKKS